MDAYVDSASTYDLISFFSTTNPEKAYPWARQATLSVTNLFINTPHVGMTSSPMASGRISGVYKKLMQQLAASNRIVPILDSEERRNVAISETKQWAADAYVIEHLKSLHDDFSRDGENYLNWIEWCVANAWIEHTRRMGSLYDQIFIPEISQILNVSQSEMRRLYVIASDAEQVADISANQHPADHFLVLKSAYTISALLRGRFHDILGERSQRQLFVHPLRNGIYPNSRKTDLREFCATNTEEYLARFAIAGAFTEKTLEGRLVTWTENIGKIRAGISQGEIDTNFPETDDAARSKALKFVIKANLSMHGKWLDTTFELLFGTAAAALVKTLYLSSWEALAIGTAVKFVANRMEFGKEIAKHATQREHRLQKLIESIPGRITQR